MSSQLRRLFSSSRRTVSLFLALSAYADAAEQSLRIKDYTWRGFAPDLVQYRVEAGAAKAKNLRVFDGSGTTVPSQWEADPSGKGGTIGFVTALPLDATVTNVVKACHRSPRRRCRISTASSITAAPISTNS